MGSKANLYKVKLCGFNIEELEDAIHTHHPGFHLPYHITKFCHLNRPVNSSCPNVEQFMADFDVEPIIGPSPQLSQISRRDWIGRGRARNSSQGLTLGRTAIKRATMHSS